MFYFRSILIVIHCTLVRSNNNKYIFVFQFYICIYLDVSELTFEGHTNDILSVSQLKDGNIISGSGDDTIKIWNNKGKIKSIIYFK